MKASYLASPDIEMWPFDPKVDQVYSFVWLVRDVCRLMDSN